MERYIINDFKLTFTFYDAVKKMGTTEPDDIELARRYYDVAMKIAWPKAIYKICYVDEVSEAGAVIGGVKFTSMRLAKNLRACIRYSRMSLPAVRKLTNGLKKKQISSLPFGRIP